ncbi:sulfurtransferase TusA family protein [Halobacillus sp. K22]|uniref:sulfurtransferase TusA family protein n=1 Tax=Halobacillus sp. K22 TaxID=3457431 RepID=UPI003FCCF786
MMDIKADHLLDAKGLACPMPIVKTKKMIKDLNSGEVVEVQATDKGSKADLQAWAKSAGHQYLGTIEEDSVLKHFIRKASDESGEKLHPATVDNEALAQNLQDDNALILDVRESAEYAFEHIPQAVSIPLGELDERINEVDQTKDVYVVCRTGSRSDLACQKLTEKGFERVYNVVPGMSEWSGQTTSLRS